MGKFCGLGPVGFPEELLKCRHNSRFHLKLVLHGFPMQNRITT